MSEVKVAQRPSVGDNVLVTYRSDGEGRITGYGGTEIGKITALYLDGTVRIGNGDVYSVQRVSHKDANWGTVSPRQKTKRKG